MGEIRTNKCEQFLTFLEVITTNWNVKKRSIQFLVDWKVFNDVGRWCQVGRNWKKNCCMWLMAGSFQKTKKLKAEARTQQVVDFFLPRLCVAKSWWGSVCAPCRLNYTIYFLYKMERALFRTFRKLSFWPFPCYSISKISRIWLINQINMYFMLLEALQRVAHLTHTAFLQLQ